MHVHNTTELFAVRYLLKSLYFIFLPFVPKKQTHKSKYIFLLVWEAKTKRNQPQTKEPIQAEVVAFLQLQPKVAISLEHIKQEVLHWRNKFNIGIKMMFPYNLMITLRENTHRK